MSMAQFQDALGDYYDAGMIGAPPTREDFPTHRIEWFGTLQVHQPIRPTVHEAAKETAVSCA